MISKTILEISELINGTLILNKGSLDTVVKGVSIDSRKIETSNLYIPIIGEKVDGHIFMKDAFEKGASLSFCSKEEYIPTDNPVIVVEDTVKALQELAKNYRTTLNAKVIGITGSNGKTSCKDILAGALSSVYKTQKTKGNHNNEIGVPLTILDLDEDVEVAVIEMGMENKDEIHFLNDIVNQDISLITNVGYAHLENLGSLENIGYAKLEIADSLKENALFVYYGDDCILSALAPNKKELAKLHVCTYGAGKANTIYLTSLLQREDGIYFTVNDSSMNFHIEILGKHQALNAMGAILIARNLGLTDKQIQEGFDQIENTGMRNELMRIHKCTVLNDSYKSNPQSAKAALDTFHEFTHPYKICVMADMLDLGEDSKKLHYDLGYSMNSYHLQEVICMGEMGKWIAKGAQESCADTMIYHYDTREEIVKHLKSYIDKDCMILFKGSRGMALDLVIEKLKEYGENYE